LGYSTGAPGWPELESCAGVAAGDGVCDDAGKGDAGEDDTDGVAAGAGAPWRLSVGFWSDDWEKPAAARSRTSVQQSKRHIRAEIILSGPKMGNIKFNITTLTEGGSLYRLFLHTADPKS
jgi:hypothetical protein